MGAWWFIRHGQSEANAADWLAGHRDVDLTARGEGEARALVQPLRALRATRRVSSDLRRAMRTATIAWGERDPILEPLEALRERHLGDWEGVPMADLRANGGIDVLLSWAGRPPGGESHRDLATRVIGWMAAHDDGRDTVAFLHGGLIRAVVGLLDGTPPDAIGLWKVGNTEIIHRQVPPGRWRQLLQEMP